jgi:hypothetical protein
MKSAWRSELLRRKAGHAKVRPWGGGSRHRASDHRVG